MLTQYLLERIGVSVLTRSFARSPLRLSLYRRQAHPIFGRQPGILVSRSRSRRHRELLQPTSKTGQSLNAFANVNSKDRGAIHSSTLLRYMAKSSGALFAGTGYLGSEIIEIRGT